MRIFGVIDLHGFVYIGYGIVRVPGSTSNLHMKCPLRPRRTHVHVPNAPYVQYREAMGRQTIKPSTKSYKQTFPFYNGTGASCMKHVGLCQPASRKFYDSLGSSTCRCM